MAYAPTAVANTLLRLAANAGTPLDPMKMQKLLYFAHGWHLGLGSGALINQPIEAWDYGPVVASLYHELKAYGAGPILAPIRDFAPAQDGRLVHTTPLVEDTNHGAFLSRILDVYGGLTALQLSEMTHRPDTPWSRTRAQYPGVRGAIIADSLMAEYFKRLADENARRQRERDAAAGRA